MLRVPPVGDIRSDTGCALTLAAALFALGYLVIPARTNDGLWPWFKMSPDAVQYLAMTTRQPADVPFRYRILVPLLASLLPVPPDTGLRIVNYTSLAVTYIVWFKLLMALAFNRYLASLSIFATFTSLGHLLIYQNPYLTDSFAFMWLSFIFYSAIQNNSMLFLLSSIAGVLTRETCLFGLPIFTTRRKVFTALIACVASIMLTMLVLFAGIPALQTSVETPYFSSAPGYLLGYAAKLYFTFGFMWIPLIAGSIIAYCDNSPNSRYVVRMFLLLTAAALTTSAIATDTTRMYSVIQVVSPALYAYYLQRVGKFGLILLPLMSLNIILGIPNRILWSHTEGLTELEEWYHRLNLLIIAHQVMGFLLASLLFVRFFREFIPSLCDTAAFPRNILQKWLR